jgi:hypothetical protein
MTEQQIFEGVQLARPFSDVTGRKPIVASGNLAGSAEEEYSTEAGAAVMRLTALDYWESLAQNVGTSPSQAEEEGLTYEDILKWTMYKGINTKAAGAIYRKIMRSGTAAYRGKNKFYQDPIGELFNDEFIARTVEQIEKNMLTAVETQIQAFIKYGQRDE